MKVVKKFILMAVLLMLLTGLAIDPSDNVNAQDDSKDIDSVNIGPTIYGEEFAIADCKNRVVLVELWGID